MQPPRGRPKKRELVVTAAQATELVQLFAAGSSEPSGSVSGQDHPGMSLRSEQRSGCGQAAHDWFHGGLLAQTGSLPLEWPHSGTSRGQEHLARSGTSRSNRWVRLTLEKTPKGATHWSSRMLATRTGLSQSSISRIWRAFGAEAASHRELSTFQRPAAG